MPNKFFSPLFFFAPTPLIEDASAGQKREKTIYLKPEGNECGRDDGMSGLRKFSDDLTILFLYAGIKE